MNLINNPWIPIRRRNGESTLITPWQITDRHDTNPVIALDAPRPDFNGALVQFLIGLLQTTTELKRRSKWKSLLQTAPSPEDLHEQFQPIADAFELDGTGPRFMQDFDIPETETNGIAGLFIEAPGGNSIKNNTDHFIKRGGIAGICHSCAATALFTLQTNAPSGGVGHRTSLRGGGPLTTLVILDPKSSRNSLETSLWRNLWLNVLDRITFLSLSGNFDKTDPSDVFPWLAPTRTSEAKARHATTTPGDTHPAQMFWGMPRRIRLDFENTRPGNCDVCSADSPALITHYTTKNYGVNYSGPWRHPLTPHSIDKDGIPLPRHAQPGGISYRHWLGLVQSGGGHQQEAAKVVDAFLERNRADPQQCRLWAFGYDMDNMKARCWYESTMPVYELETATVRQHFASTVERCVNAANEVRGYLITALKEAWFERLKDAKGDFSFIDLAFWQDTEADFYAVLQTLADGLNRGEPPDVIKTQAKEQWHRYLYDKARDLFDQWATSGGFEYENPRRIFQARNKLLNRSGSRSKKLWGNILELPLKPKRTQGETMHAPAL